MGNVPSVPRFPPSSWIPGYYNSNGSTSNQYVGGGTSYDGNGNLTNDTFNTYTWDSDGNIATVNGTTTNTYDAFDKLVETSVGPTQFVYLPGGNQPFLTMSNYQTYLKAFAPAPGGAMIMVPNGKEGAVSYHRHTDWIGSSRFATTPAETAYSDVAYAPFGEPYAPSGTTDLVFGGNTQDASVVEGATAGYAYDTPNRKYSASQSRWIMPDPAGIGAADPTNPQSWNRYAYVLNNPLSNIDPLGLDCVRLNDDGSTTTYTDDQDNCEGDNGYYFDGTVTNTFVDANNNVLANVNGQFGCSGDSGCSMYNNLTSITVNGGTPGQVGTFTSGLNGYIPYSLFSPSMFKSGGPPPIAQIGKPHLSRSQAKARCFVAAQLDNNGFDSEGFHAPDPGRALFPNQGTNVFNNTTQVLPSSSQPSVSVNPQGAESGEGAESVALFGYFAAIGESYTRCMEAYDALVSSGSIGQ